ncbi:IS1096 element passenger TnpR family protein [Luteimonas deserti]|uniref:Plasmid pRiA4b Orf3-like domain-containing protein n=1 Tax=Luteimonas deserti TaxID=2752306 RepID=A0A7Z0QS73_9GAMM|nr:hypothetical protein [Luteimonas deserti]
MLQALSTIVTTSGPPAIWLTPAAISARAAGTAWPRDFDGDRNAPPADCGGMAGLDHLLDALADPADPSPRTCSNGCTTTCRRVPGSLF